jgi:hypothetical protein
MSTTRRPTPPVAPVTSTTSNVSIFFGASLEAEPVKLLMMDSTIYKKRQKHQELKTASIHTPKLNVKCQQAGNAEVGDKTFRGFGGPLKKYKVLTNLPMSQDCCPAKAITSLRDGLYVIRGNCLEPRKNTFCSVLVVQEAVNLT